MDTVKNIQRAIDFLEDNILDELSSEIIASQAYMSSFHFGRIFSVICGITLGGIYQEQKAYPCRNRNNINVGENH